MASAGREVARPLAEATLWALAFFGVECWSWKLQSLAPGPTRAGGGGAGPCPEAAGAAHVAGPTGLVRRARGIKSGPLSDVLTAQGPPTPALWPLRPRQPLPSSSLPARHLSAPHLASPGTLQLHLPSPAQQ